MWSGRQDLQDQTVNRRPLGAANHRIEGMNQFVNTRVRDCRGWSSEMGGGSTGSRTGTSGLPSGRSYTIGLWDLSTTKPRWASCVINTRTSMSEVWGPMISGCRL